MGIEPLWRTLVVSLKHAGLWEPLTGLGRALKAFTDVLLSWMDSIFDVYGIVAFIAAAVRFAIYACIFIVDWAVRIFVYIIGLF